MPPTMNTHASIATRIASLGLVIALCACGAPREESRSSDIPPPIPEGAETVEFERMTQAERAAAEIDSAETTPPEKPLYWGVKDGEPQLIMWEDLMPEGSEEELIKQYEDFYAMLEKRYAANTTTLADADPYGAIAEGSEFDYMPQLGTFDTVEELDGEHVRIPGYVVPFDFNSDNRQQEFLFVPYMGACIHTPPPPPNQIIFIRAEPAVKVKDIWVPYWVEGTLSTETTENELGDTAYTLQLGLIEPYATP
ncbi:MAG: DUF3299 domain-containing protein [Pseudomonadota bacterium]